METEEGETQNKSTRVTVEGDYTGTVTRGNIGDVKGSNRGIILSVTVSSEIF